MRTREVKPRFDYKPDIEMLFTSSDTISTSQTQNDCVCHMTVFAELPAYGQDEHLQRKPLFCVEHNDAVTPSLHGQVITKLARSSTLLLSTNFYSF